MIPSVYLAMLCKQIYTEMPTVWDHYWSRDDVVVARRVVEGDNVIVFRGSATLEDWERDLQGLPTKHKHLGWCHSGFLEGMDNLVEEILPTLSGRIIVTGHSLGAARALLFTALATIQKVSIERTVVFGCPRPGSWKLARLLRGCATKIESYRNRDDPVTYVPYLMGFYAHPIEPTQVEAPRSPRDVPPLSDHRMESYIQGVSKLPVQP